MIIKDLKELETFLKLCRKQGVQDIKYGDCSVVFGDVPRKPRKGESDDVETEEPSPDELIYFSSGGVPPP